MASLNSYTQIGRREDLIDKLVQLGDSKAKLVSSFKMRTNTSTMLTEWQDYELATPTANAQVQGFTVTGTYTVRSRRSNYVQIMSTPVEVDDTTIENMNVAGVRNEWEFQTSTKFVEHKRDLEWALINNSTSATGVSATASASGQALGMFGAVTTNVSAPAASSSVFTEDEFIDLIRKIYDATGDPADGLQFHSGTLNVKRVTDFTGINKTMSVGPGDSVHNRQVTTILTNFGSVSLIPNIMVGNSKFGLFDFATWAYVSKVAPKFKLLGRTGDSQTGYWKSEWSLHWLSERSNATMSGIATA